MDANHGQALDGLMDEGMTEAARTGWSIMHFQQVRHTATGDRWMVQASQRGHNATLTATGGTPRQALANLLPLLRQADRVARRPCDADWMRWYQ